MTETDVSSRSAGWTARAVIVFLLIGAVCVLGSLYLPMMAVKAVIYGGRLSAWGWELMVCMIGGPLIGFLTYCLAFMIGRSASFGLRCVMNCAVGVVSSVVGMVLFYAIVM